VGHLEYDERPSRSEEAGLQVDEQDGQDIIGLPIEDNGLPQTLEILSEATSEARERLQDPLQSDPASLGVNEHAYGADSNAAFQGGDVRPPARERISQGARERRDYGPGDRRPVPEQGRPRPDRVPHDVIPDPLVVVGDPAVDPGPPGPGDLVILDNTTGGEPGGQDGPDRIPQDGPDVIPGLPGDLEILENTTGGEPGGQDGPPEAPQAHAGRNPEGGPPVPGVRGRQDALVGSSDSPGGQ